MACVRVDPLLLLNKVLHVGKLKPESQSAGNRGKDDCAAFETWRAIAAPACMDIFVPCLLGAALLADHFRGLNENL